MQECVQQRNESTATYFHSKVRLCREVNLDFHDTREQVLTGLRSLELCTMLLGRTPGDEDDFLYDILVFERIEWEQRKATKKVRDVTAESGKPSKEAERAHKATQLRIRPKLRLLLKWA
ncbi:hypothetical protein HPB49_001665 [Dermacentor silvarum]|uniref:Uncharacterized protein n=1 Tax=Dermacentor silvarum TaxID=543639 RepID=A0ACB8DSZ4_DERSI|nr:hypothetical protein HPB49_001665 [Dermacentor silvarum]